MNIAFFKLGARISPIKTNNINRGEVDAFVNIFSLNKENKVYVFSKFTNEELMLSKDNIEYVNIDSKDFLFKDYDIDKLVVLNGPVNHFGGTISPFILKTYECLSQWEGVINYILVDISLPLIDIKNDIIRLMKDEEYAQRLSIGEKTIQILTQARKTSKLEETFRKKGISNFSFKYFPLDQYPLSYFKKLKYNDSPETDLIYGGGLRSGRRTPYIVKYYFGNDLKTVIFGKLPLEKFEFFNKEKLSIPDIEPEIDFGYVCKKLNTSLSSVLIGDKMYYESQSMGIRLWECVISQTVILIDSEFDKERRYSDWLTDWVYVNNREEAQKKILEVKKDDRLRKEIIERQNTFLESWKVEDYRNDIMRILK